MNNIWFCSLLLWTLKLLCPVGDIKFDCSSNTSKRPEIVLIYPALPHSKDSTIKVKLTPPTGKKKGLAHETIYGYRHAPQRFTEVHALLVQIIIHGLTYTTSIGLETQTAHNTLECWKGTQNLLEPKRKLKV